MIAHRRIPARKRRMGSLRRFLKALTADLRRIGDHKPSSRNTRTTERNTP